MRFAVSRQRIIGAIFLSETTTPERYQELIMNFIFRLEIDEQGCSIQQGGATVRAENSTIQLLSELFGGHIISRKMWPPSSPDL